MAIAWEENKLFFVNLSDFKVVKSITHEKGLAKFGHLGYGLCFLSFGNELAELDLS